MFRDNFPGSSEVIWKRFSVLLVLPLMLASVAGAQSQTPPAPSQPGPAPNAPRPIPGAIDPAANSAQVDLGTYIIGPNDMLYVSVFREPNWTNYYPVRTDGMIGVPLFGEMKAAGLTPMQLTKQLKEMLSSQLNDPEVLVTVFDVRSKMYSVTGQVGRPGNFPLIKPTTVFDALNEAGGFRDNFSNRKDVLIIRGEKGRFHFNYNDYVKGKNTDKNIVLQNGDVVNVN